MALHDLFWDFMNEKAYEKVYDEKVSFLVKNDFIFPKKIHFYIIGTESPYSTYSPGTPRTVQTSSQTVFVIIIYFS